MRGVGCSAGVPGPAVLPRRRHACPSVCDVSGGPRRAPSAGRSNCARPSAPVSAARPGRGSAVVALPRGGVRPPRPFSPSPAGSPSWSPRRVQPATPTAGGRGARTDYQLTAPPLWAAAYSAVMVRNRRTPDAAWDARPGMRDIHCTLLARVRGSAVGTGCTRSSMRS